MENDTYYIVKNTESGLTTALRIVRGTKAEVDKVARILSYNSQNGGYKAVQHVDTIPEHIPIDAAQTLLRYFSALSLTGG